MQERAAAVPLDLGLGPLALDGVLILHDVLVLDDAADLASVEEAEGRAEGRRRPGELEKIATVQSLANFLFPHDSILRPAGTLVKPTAARRDPARQLPLLQPG